MQRQVGGPAAVVREFFSGVRLLGAGLRMWVTAPRLMLIGAVPALLVAAVYLAGLVLLAVNLDAIATWATPFAADWQEPFRSGMRITTALAILAVTALLAVYTFVALTLLVGDPFYERIWRAVEKRLGGMPDELDQPFWPSVLRGAGDALRLLAATAALGILLFAGGFIPVVGQTVIPVLAALVGGWFLAVELTSFAFEARGLRLRERRRVLGANRARAVGFGVATYLVFLVPLGAVIVMPAAVAGATLLTRGVLERQPARA
ncbi:EI24 domain-containing protein [Planctomonas deserti]|uniref:EI24 domain-containing protein n=1 Tax=Planctomonas deserti TaxID=2144185 RepID=UPI00197B3889|nr:EI24 domain-containing protein [Planctomonas deserti]